MTAVAPFFSTIIPAFNRGTLIGPTIDSALAQGEDGELQEIIVVDDGSTDDTSAILRRYQSEHPGVVRFVQQANAGPGSARNHGVREARGKYIAFLDSDDLWFPWTLKTYQDVIEQHQQPSFLIGTAEPFAGSTTPAQSQTAGETSIERFDDFFASSHTAFWHGCSVAVVRADILRATGGFTEQNINAEDTDLWMKLGTAPGFVHVRSPVTAGYRGHPASAVGQINKTRDGMLHLIQQERAGNYPGGDSRRTERLTMLTRHLRAASMGCLSAGQTKDAWNLYLKSFAWNARQLRMKYLLGFPVAAVVKR